MDDMDEKFQDRIDDYLFNRMADADKEAFLHEIERDEGKKEQMAFTRQVKDSVCSREEKLKALASFRQQYEEDRKKVALRPTGIECAACYCPASAAGIEPVRSNKRIWFWVSGVAAVFVIGFFAVSLMFEYVSSPSHDGIFMEQMRGGDEIFCPVFNDSTDIDTIEPRSRETNISDE